MYEHIKVEFDAGIVTVTTTGMRTARNRGRGNSTVRIQSPKYVGKPSWLVPSGHAATRARASTVADQSGASGHRPVLHRHHPGRMATLRGDRQMHLDALAAYIDPGSGSLIIQAVIATIVAIPFFFRQQIGRVVRTLRRDGTAEETVTPVPPTTPDPR